MTAPATTQAEPAGTKHIARARVLIIVVAAIQLLNSLSGIPVLFSEGVGFTGWALGVRIVILPVLALAALVLAFRHRLRDAILAVAAIGLAIWAAELVTTLFYSPKSPGSGSLDAYLFLQMVAYPLLAVAAAILAWRNERLGLAAILASLPTVLGVLAIVAFGIGVAITGF